MVMYIDQRPTRASDTLREQMRRLRVPASTPHGIKIATAAEATRTWTPPARLAAGMETLSPASTRASEATKVVSQARQTLRRLSLAGRGGVPHPGSGAADKQRRHHQRRWRAQKFVGAVDWAGHDCARRYRCAAAACDGGVGRASGASHEHRNEETRRD